MRAVRYRYYNFSHFLKVLQSNLRDHNVLIKQAIIMVFNDIPVYLGVIGFILMGIGSFCLPEKVTAQFDIPTLSTAGKNEVRAVYGGFGVLMGLMLIIALFTPNLREGICLTVAAALGGMAIGRFLSAVLDRHINGFPLFYMCLEAVLASLLFFAA